MTRAAALALALALSALGGCGDRYATNGPCSADAECQLCRICGCERAYASADVGDASCDAVLSGASCPPGQPSACLGGGAYRALCVSGHCQAVAP